MQEKNLEDYSYTVKNILLLENNLVNKGLELDRKYDAFNMIGLFGYQNVVQKYKKSFLEPTGNFKTGTKFSDIADLFYFDLKLRKEVFSLIQKIELIFKNAMINVISYYISADFNVYTMPDKFKEKSPYKGEDGKYPTRSWLRREIKKKVKKTMSSNPMPYELISKMYFHHVVNWYFLLNDTLRRKVALYILVGPLFDDADLNPEGDPNVIVDYMLRICTAFRNQAAHEGNIFNYYNDEICLPFKAAYFRGKNIIPEGKQYKFGIGLLLVFTYCMTDKTLYNSFDECLYKVVKEYIRKLQ